MNNDQATRREGSERHRTPASLLCLLLTLLFSNTSPALEIHRFLYDEIGSAALESENVKAINHLLEDRVSRALLIFEQLEDAAEREGTVRAKIRLQSNHALAEYLDGRVSKSLERLDKAIQELANRPDLQPELETALLLKSYIARRSDRESDARDALLHAQYLVHREDGVYSEAQLSIIDDLVALSLAAGKFNEADQHQRYRLRLLENIHGTHSIELIDPLNRIGSYFTNRAADLPPDRKIEGPAFAGRTEILTRPSAWQSRRARRAMFEEAAAILQRGIDIAPPDDPQIVPLLKEYARNRFLRGARNGRARTAMERAVEIAMGSEHLHQLEQAQLQLDLADLYLMIGDPRAPEFYRSAWRFMISSKVSQSEIKSLMVVPTRLIPHRALRPVLHHRPLATMPGEELFVSLRFDIDEKGRPRRIREVNANIPRASVSGLKNVVSRMKFRPGIVNGELVALHDIDYQKTFQVRQ